MANELPEHDPETSPEETIEQLPELDPSRVQVKEYNPKSVGEITPMPNERWIGEVDDGAALIEIVYDNLGQYRAMLVNGGKALYEAAWWPMAEDGDIEAEMNHFLTLCCVEADI